MMALAAVAVFTGAAACWRAASRDRVGTVVFIVAYLIALLAMTAY